MFKKDRWFYNMTLIAILLVVSYIGFKIDFEIKKEAVKEAFEEMEKK